MRTSLYLVSVATLAASLSAQSTPQTIPQNFETREGGRSRHVPLQYQPARIQCAYDAIATGWSAPKIILSLKVRQDTSAAQNVAAAFKTDLQIWLSSNGADMNLASNVFNTNHGKDKVLFMKKKTYNFAPFAASTVKPAKFNIDLKGDKPFIALKPTLLVDWAAYSTAYQTGGFYVDATTPQANALGSFTARGTGCNPSNFTLTTTASNVNEGSPFQQTGNTQNAGDFVLEWLGAKAISAPIGGGCTLYAPLTTFYPVPAQTTTSNGAFTFNWGTIPLGMRGKQIYVQAGAITKSFGLRFSNALDITFGMTGTNNHGTFHRYGYGSGFNPDTGAITYGWVGTGIIFQIN